MHGATTKIMIFTRCILHFTTNITQLHTFLIFRWSDYGAAPRAETCGQHIKPVVIKSTSEIALIYTAQRFAMLHYSILYHSTDIHNLCVLCSHRVYDSYNKTNEKH